VARRSSTILAPAAGLLALAASLPAALAQDAPTIAFSRPRAGATVVGAATAALLVQVPAGASVRHVDLFVDGKRTARLTGPPWETTWDAGSGDRGHTLDAVLVLGDGRQTKATVHTSRIHVDMIARVDLVNLYAVVRDRAGTYVAGLPRESFRVVEDGTPQTIERFSEAHQPLRVAVVLDTSLSMLREGRIDRAREAALDFVQLLLPEDEATVVTFNDTVRVAQPRTSDRELLSAAILAAQASGGTALYDAVWKASRTLDGFEGRRVLVLLSDGNDESASGLEPGSLHTLEEALDQALRSSVMIFSIGIGSNLDEQYARRWDSRTGVSYADQQTSLADVLRRLADSTGGRAEISVGAGRLRRVFAQVGEDLRHQYSIAYTSSNPARDGKWREVRLTTPGRDLEVVTRKGYYAPKTEAAR